MVLFGLFGVVNEILFRICFIIVWSCWVLIFLIDLFRLIVIEVILLIVFFVNDSVICLVFIKVIYCLIRLVLGFVRIVWKFFCVSVLSFIWIGRWFCNFGRRLDGLVIWKVFDVMNRIWFVFIGLCLVEIMVFLISGSKFCWMFLWEILLLVWFLCV